MDEEGYRIIFIAHRLCLCKTLMIFTTAPCQDAYWIIASALGISSPANHGEVIVVRPQIQDFFRACVGMGMGLAAGVIAMRALNVSGIGLVNYLLSPPRRAMIEAPSPPPPPPPPPPSGRAGSCRRCAVTMRRWRNLILGVLSGAPPTDDEDDEGLTS